MRLNKMLWTMQGLLAVLFVFAGATKLVLPVEVMQQGPVHFSGTFLRFIGFAELLGAIGLVLPGVLRTQQMLTPIAAGGLLIIMVGATAVTAMGGPIAPALFPLGVGVIAGTVAYGRSRAATLATSI